MNTTNPYVGPTRRIAMRGEAEVRGMIFWGRCTDCNRHRFLRSYFEVILEPQRWDLCVKCATRRAKG